MRKDSSSVCTASAVILGRSESVLMRNRSSLQKLVLLADSARAVFILFAAENILKTLSVRGDKKKKRKVLSAGVLK